MNIKCHFIRPHSISEINHCHPIVNCCNCINECICQSNLLNQKSCLSQNNYCDTFPSKITYELSSQKKIFNPISLYSNIPKDNNLISRNNSISNNMFCRTLSGSKFNHFAKRICDNSIKNINNNYKKNSLIEEIPNRIDSPININKSLNNKINNNFRDYINNKKRNKYLNYRKKIKELPENMSGVYNNMFGKNKNIKDNIRNLKLCNISDNINKAKKINGLNRRPNNNLVDKRKISYSSIDQTKREESKEHQNNLDDENNLNKYNSETMAKIIIDKEIKNKNLENEINNIKNNYDSLKDEYDKIYKENEDIKKINDDFQNKFKKYKSDIYLLKKRNEEDKEMYEDIENKNNELLNKIKPNKNS